MAAVTTLPAAFVANTVLTATQMNDLRGAFRVLQVVQGTISLQTSTTSSSFVTTGLTASITPSSSSSKILVLCGLCIGSSASADSYFTIVRGATNLGTASGFVNWFSANGQGGAGVNYLDSPATTSSTAYTVHFRTGGSGTAYMSVANTTNSIVLMEVSA